MADTKKVVINACYGGFGLSARAIKRLAELQGRECYFFTSELPDISKYFPCSIEKADEAFMFFAFDIPDAHERLLGRGDDWHDLTDDQRKQRNEDYRAHQIEAPERDDRHNPLLVQIVEELGDAANGKCAKLRIVEIPADVEYSIEEYDGNEHIAEAHRTWS